MRRLWSNAGSCLGSTVLMAVPVLIGCRAGKDVSSRKQQALSESESAVASPAPQPEDVETPPSLPKAIVLPQAPVVSAVTGGYLPGSSSVTPTGAYQYGIPLDVPEGRAGMKP